MGSFLVRVVAQGRKGGVCDQTTTHTTTHARTHATEDVANPSPAMAMPVQQVASPVPEEQDPDFFFDASLEHDLRYDALNDAEGGDEGANKKGLEPLPSSSRLFLEDIPN